jgi:hypothetical protein
MAGWENNESAKINMAILRYYIIHVLKNLKKMYKCKLV